MSYGSFVGAVSLIVTLVPTGDAVGASTYGFWYRPLAGSAIVVHGFDPFAFDVQVPRNWE